MEEEELVGEGGEREGGAGRSRTRKFIMIEWENRVEGGEIKEEGRALVKKVS